MNFLEYLMALKRRSKALLMLFLDVLVLPFAFYSSIGLRESSFYPNVSEYSWLFFCIPILIVPVFIRIGLYRAVIRFMDIKLLWTIFYGSTIGVLLVSTLVALARFNSLPRSSLAIFWVFSFVYIAATRLLARGFLQGVELRVDKKKRVAIYGAGRAGAQIAQALFSSREYRPILFFDDSLDLQRSSLLGLKIFSPQKIEELIFTKSIDEILIALPSVSRSRQREIIENLKKYPLMVKILPAVADVVSGKIRFEDIREVQVEDLLGRDRVPPREDLLRACVSGKVVCVTGAGGSIGSELSRQLATLDPLKLILVEQSEFALYKIEEELKRTAPFLTVEAFLLDVCEQSKIERVFKDSKVETVYHAAAYKHVPLVELNPVSGIKNNSLGTLSCAQASITAGVKTFILISTDKAVRPTNVMGASKRLAELMLQALSAENHKTIFTMVRFGNVLGSSGSVVPLFREQIRRGGPVTVTHPEVIRYFMTISEAALLVIQAGSMAKGGEVFLLDMGEPVKIYDLAKKMIELSGLELRTENSSNGDIEVKFTGLRPGEKLFEELLIGDGFLKTDHPGIMKGQEGFLNIRELQKLLSLLVDKCNEHSTSNNHDDVKTALNAIVKEYVPQLACSI